MRDLIVIPGELREGMIARIHRGHQGLVRFLRMARTNIYGPGMRADLRRYIDGCSKCIIHRKMKTLSMNPSKLPDPPWHTLELDLFEYKSKDYLLMIDYYSRWIEVIEIKKKTVETVVKEMKKVFVRFGLPC